MGAVFFERWLLISFLKKMKVAMKNKLIIVLGSSAVVLLVLVVFLIVKSNTGNENPKETVDFTTETEEEQVMDPFLISDAITEDYLTINEYSRPGDKLEKINGVVIHYVGNPGTSAKNNRNYFESLKDTHERSASSHYIVGLEGEILQCIPLDEIAYASNSRNSDTIAIECCHPDSTGKFNSYTYESVVKLTAALCKSYGLNPLTDVIRHYDVSGKECPVYYVENENEWRYFLLQVISEME